MTESEGKLSETGKKIMLLNKLNTEAAPIKSHIDMENGTTYDFTINPTGFATALKLL